MRPKASTRTRTMLCSFLVVLGSRNGAFEGGGAFGGGASWTVALGEAPPPPLLLPPPLLAAAPEQVVDRWYQVSHPVFNPCRVAALRMQLIPETSSGGPDDGDPLHVLRPESTAGAIPRRGGAVTVTILGRYRRNR